MLTRLRERITRWLFGPPPREDDWEIRYEYLPFVRDSAWVVYRNDVPIYATRNKSKLEQWLDWQDNRERE